MVHLPLPSIFTEFPEVCLGIQQHFPSHSHPSCLGRQGIQGPKSHVPVAQNDWSNDWSPDWIYQHNSYEYM